MRPYIDPTDVEFEIVDDADGYAGHADARGVGGIPAEIAVLLATLAGPLVRGREAVTLNLLLGSLGLLRDPTAAAAAMATHEAALNDYLRHIDLGAVARSVAEGTAGANPGLAACAAEPRAALPLVALGAVLGAGLTRFLDDRAGD